MNSATRTLLHFRTWLTPLLLVVGLGAVLPAIYLTSTIDPQGSLKDLPVALVVETQDASGGPDLAALTAQAIHDGTGAEIALTVMTDAEVSKGMQDDTLAGAVVIPSDFNAGIGTVLEGSAPSAMPEVRIETNAGAGGLSVGLVNGNLAPVLRAVAQVVGQQLNAQTAAVALPDASRTLLATPFTVTSAPYSDLPAHAGLGTSVFYYALVLVLLGFLGASLINPLIDSALGFAPSEIGPAVQRNPYTRATRVQTLLAKFAVITAAAPLVALVVQLIATGPLGIPVPEPVTLWLFSSAVIAAIGTSALSIFAIFGAGIGALVNTVFFIALSMTSSGGTVPLAAIPEPFRWLSHVEPFYPIVNGMRALLYYDANPAAGLADAWIRIGIGAAAGLALGLIVAWVYDRIPRFTRHPATA